MNSLSRTILELFHLFRFIMNFLASSPLSAAGFLVWSLAFGANPSLDGWLGLSTSTLALSIPPLRKLLPSGPNHWDLGAPKGRIARTFLDIESTLKYMQQSTCHITSLCISYEWMTINWSILYLQQSMWTEVFPSDTRFRRRWNASTSTAAT